MDRGIRSSRRWFLALGFGFASAMSIAVQAQMCGGQSYPFPYTDVSGVGSAFCPGIMEAYVTGISKGTTSSTFDPNGNVIRLQMTTFLQRTVDQVLARGSRRAALKQWPTPQNTNAMQQIDLGTAPYFCAADGDNIWVSNNGTEVLQVEASSGKLLGTWTGTTASWDVLVAAGKVFVEDNGSPGALYVIDPTQSPGALTSVATLPDGPSGIAFDGTNLWTSNFSGSLSIIKPQSPYTVTPVPGFVAPVGIIYDGANIWVTDHGAGKLFKLNAAGGVVKSISVGTGPQHPVFDGANIWVPSDIDNSVTVVQASSGVVVAKISTDASNQLNAPTGAAFDGERVLIVNNSGNSVTLFKAADLSFIANVTTGPSSSPTGPCSDGINFWINTTKLVRF